MTNSPSFFIRFTSIGNLPEDTEEEKLSKRFLILMAVFMSMGGILWGTISLVFGLFFPMTIPYGYTILSAINLSLFYKHKNFSVARTFQVFISLILPFLFQWSLGGFISSGGVQLWALLSLVGSISFQSIRSSSYWLLAYLFFSLVSYFIDDDVAIFKVNTPDHISVLFLSLNYIVISAIVTGLVLFFVYSRDVATNKLKKFTEQLEEIVAQRTIELRNSFGYQSAILDNIVDGLVSFNLAGEVTGFNPSIVHLYEFKQNINGKHYKNLFKNDLILIIEKSISMQKMISGEIDLFQGKIGKAVALRIITTENGEDRILGTLLLVRDITKEKEIDRMKTEFISNVSHELRTPLTSILGFTRIIKKKLDEAIFPLISMEDKKNSRNTNQIKDNIDIIVKEGERLTSLINDVLDIAKMEAGKIEWKMSTISMNEVIDRAIASTSSLFSGGQITMEKDIQDDLPNIIGDKDRLIQVIINLISNGYKFTNDGIVTVKAVFSDRKVVVSVVDSGVGIAKEDQHKVFEKFKQVGDTLTDKPKGTGLGLPICKQIVEHHNGVIWVESEVGKGSIFSFTIPVTGMVQIKKQAIDFYKLPEMLASVYKHLESPAPMKTILIVDDEKNIRDLLKQELEYVGYNTLEAMDGLQALDVLKSNHVDLILLDVMMPELNGFDVASSLRSDPFTISIPIVILTIVEDQKRGIEMGVDDYQQKPIQLALLLPKIEELLQKKVSVKNIMVVHQDENISQKLLSIFEKVGHTTFYMKPQSEGFAQKLIDSKLDLLIMDTYSATATKIHEQIFKEPALKNLLVYITESE